MLTLKEYFNKSKKEDIYKFYSKLYQNPKDYHKITRNEMYNNIVSMYLEDPEIILKLCTIEEIDILKNLINDNKLTKNNGYIEYVLLNNLKNNYLILESDEYYIPEDILNYVKMALNILDEAEYSLKDVTDSVLIGLIRIYNTISIEQLHELLPVYSISITINILRKYILESPKLKELITIVKYKKKEYVISLENCCYKDILNIIREDIKLKKYTLEEVISIGKYKINLFKEEVFNFLCFLETHLDPIYIDIIINELTIYMGFDINDNNTLKLIADNIEELYLELKKVVVYLPIWIYKGNDLSSLNQNKILPDKNSLCPCGSGKKYKHCCGK